jgi:predicted nucleotidyltransferase
VARGEQRPDSDIDITVEIAQDARIGLIQYVGIVQFIDALLPMRVDVANREGLKPLLFGRARNMPRGLCFLIRRAS